jgi:sarcosine oxidase, subunit beta
VKSTADVVIVGGGCMGASVAYHLGLRGITDVVLAERERFLGTGSTGRNAGGVRHQFSNEANIRLSIESIALFERFKDQIGYDIDFYQDGYLFLLSTSAAVETFRRTMALQRRLGVDVEWLEPDEAARLAPGIRVDGVLGATFCRRDGIADPHGVTMGFARAAQRMGVAIERGVEVTGIAVDRDRVVRVDTTRGSVATRHVVNAAGPYAGRIGRKVGLHVPVEPYRRHIFIAQPPAAQPPAAEPSAIRAVAPDRAGAPEPHAAAGPRAWEVPASRIMVIDFETTFYFHREGAGILFGMADRDESPTFDTTVRWDFLEAVTAVAVDRLPALAQASVSHAWAGLYEMTPDANPIIGSAREVEGFFLINGFSGHGFQHSPAAGRIVADLIAGVDCGMDLSPFAFQRFGASVAGGERCVV